MKNPSFAPWLGLSLLTVTTLSAADWPQYRGPNNDGSTPEKISAPWPTAGPRVVWKAPLGPSFGSFAVSDGRAFGHALIVAARGQKPVLAFRPDLAHDDGNDRD